MFLLLPLFHSLQLLQPPQQAQLNQSHLRSPRSPQVPLLAHLNHLTPPLTQSRPTSMTHWPYSKMRPPARSTRTQNTTTPPTPRPTASHSPPGSPEHPQPPLQQQQQPSTSRLSIRLLLYPMQDQAKLPPCHHRPAAYQNQMEACVQYRQTPATAQGGSTPHPPCTHHLCQFTRYPPPIPPPSHLLSLSGRSWHHTSPTALQAPVLELTIALPPLCLLPRLRSIS